MKTLLIAFALVLVFEGALPFMVPGAWRRALRRVMEFSDGQLRFIGLISVACGIVMLLLLI